VKAGRSKGPKSHERTTVCIWSGGRAGGRNALGAATAAATEAASQTERVDSRTGLERIPDPRQPKKCRHRLTVLLLYGLLMFVFQFASRREVNRELTRPQFEANLQLLFPELVAPWLWQTHPATANASAHRRRSNSKFGRHRATSGGCGARNRRTESLTPSGAPYPPYNEAGFVGWISAAHPPLASLPTRCWRGPPKFGTAGLLALFQNSTIWSSLRVQPASPGVSLY
jgi:hypothetical protein